MMKKTNILLIAVPALVLASGIWFRLNNGQDWNVCENSTNAAEVFAGLRHFINSHSEDGFPEKRTVKEYTRQHIPYIMVYFSHRKSSYQAAFWDFEYTWVYDSESGKIYRMNEDMSDTAWYDPASHKLFSPDEVKGLICYRL